jgi:[protein-PII] uridylyltransferase
VPVEPSVEFAADAESQRATIAEVRAPDRLGLLSTVAGALAGVGCNIVSATVASIAGGVVDTFYLQTPAGEKLTSEQRDAASKAVMSALT